MIKMLKKHDTLIALLLIVLLSVCGCMLNDGTSENTESEIIGVQVDEDVVELKENTNSSNRNLGSSNGYTSSKAYDGVPDEIVNEFLEDKYNFHHRCYMESPSTTSKPAYKNTIKIHQRKDTMLDAGNFLVSLSANISSAICTREVEVQCEYRMENKDGGEYWRCVSSNEKVTDIEWNYSNLQGCWWVGGVGMDYRSFFITNINVEEKTMNIKDSNNREYSTSYQTFEDRIEVDVKYDIAKWVIYSEGPCFGSYFMTKR